MYKGINMNEEDLKSCKISEKEWKCPVAACQQILSRKQTLQSHLYCLHKIKAGNPVKRYKLYESDVSEPVPRSTRYALQQKSVAANPDIPSPEENSENDKEISGLEPGTANQEISYLEENTENNRRALHLETGTGNSEIGNVDYSTKNDRGRDINLKSGCCDVFVSRPFTEMDHFELPPTCMLDHSDSDDMDIDMCDEAYEESDTAETACSSDEEQEPVQSTKSVPDPPLYVLQTSDMYSSSITSFEHVIATGAFCARHNLSDMAIRDLLTLLQLHIPKDNTGETSIYQLKDKCGFNKSYLTFQLYCDTCKKLFSDESENCQTPGCQGVKTDPDCKKYFVTSNIKQQLAEILERKDMRDVTETSKMLESSETISDVHSGTGYKQLTQPGGFLHDSSNITLSMFTDGVPLFKSSGVQIWPVYLLINEIPPKERFTRKNMLLWGVWQGKGKPKMNMFLRPLILDLIELYNTGLTITTSKGVKQVKAMLILATMDLQARAYVTGMTQHNGEYGCLYCEEPGEVVASGAGSCRSYTVRQELVVQRTDESTREYARIAHEDGKRHKGFLGLSVLHYLPYFSMTKNIVIDYMHGTLLGITKKLLELWFDKKQVGTEHYIGHQIGRIDEILKTIQPPYMVHRLPRILSNTYNHWKASELRNWLLFYSVPCLEDSLPTVYLKHFCCLVEATYILLSEGISPADMKRADTFLKFFVSNGAYLYGKSFLSLNVHNLTHLTQFVKLWGPLWGWSCFPFESFNGEIKKTSMGPAMSADKYFGPSKHKSEFLVQRNIWKLAL